MYTNKQDNLWIGTLNQGFKVIYKYRQRFNANAKLHKLLEKQSVTAMALDIKSNLWIATYSDNLYIYNINTDQINHIDLKKFYVEDPYFQDKISSIYIDSDNVIWLQSDAKLTKCTYDNGKLNRSHIFNEQMRIYDLAEDGKGTKWIGTRENYLCAIPKGEESYHRVNLHASNFKNYQSILLRLSSGKLLVATSQQYISIIDPNSWSIERVNLNNTISEANFIPTILFENSDKEIYLGILNQGLYKLDLISKNAKYIEGIPCKDISSIIEDKDKNLWIGTLYGLSKYDRQLKRFFTYYSYDGIGGNQFNYKSALRLPDNSLIFGGTHGITIFKPSDIQNKRNVPLLFEQIKPIGNLPTTNKANLKYDNNDLTISFVALDYSNYPRVRYYYKMDGVDNDWIDARNNRQVSYPNLIPGKYKFNVYISGSEDNNIIAKNSFVIDVSPSPWLNIWAITLYIILIGCFIVYINNLYLHIKNNKNMAQIAMREKEHERHINKMNMSFFTNISHEFRTPLTMISGPIKTILMDDHLDSHNKRLLNIVNRSITRMIRLVDQILYFNRLDDDVISPQLNNTDIVHEVNQVLEIFNINDNIKNLTIQTVGLDKSFFIMLDKDIFEKIMNNILSNAFKYSPENGKIIIRFDIIKKDEVAYDFNLDINNTKLYDNYIRLIVEDNGHGIPEDKLEDIFLRYYQVKSNNKLTGYNWGTGIGLYYTKRLISLLHGYIKASNRNEGGAAFTLVIPIINNNTPNVFSLKHEESNNQYYQYKGQGDIVENLKIENDTDNKFKILIIDDDPEIVAYLQTLLQRNYIIENKYSGESAYESLDNVNPDIILCDVIMQGMSGYDFCKKLKSNPEYSHIPIILLTAKSSIGEQIEGLNEGANAYVSKPFDPSYLIAVIKSQLINLHNIRILHIRILLKESTQLPLDNNILSNRDIQFMERLYKLMEDELSNTEINVTEIATIMGMSRTKFYHKVKGLTGENPNSFFRNFKLNKAAEFIKSGNFNITEIADMTGFSSLSHFSISFKKQFGTSPKDYK